MPSDTTQPDNQAPSPSLGAAVAQPPQQQDMVQAAAPQAGGQEGGRMGFGQGQHHNNGLRIAVLGVALIIAIVLIYHLYGGAAPVATTTVPAVSYSISSCTDITSPGTYYVTGDIGTAIDNGSCIGVRSANVRVVGQGHSITGSGPFVDTPPFSYGVEVYSQSNVSISGLTISKFSYGVVLYNSNHVTLSNLTVRNSTITGLELNGSSNNAFYAVNVSGSTGISGGMYVLRGDNNTFQRSSSLYNSYEGLSFSNSTGNGVYNSLVIGSPVDLSCSYNSTLRSSNKVSNTTCYVNDQCNFAYCSEVNTQAAISSVRLYGSSINKCGTISGSGSYALAGNLNLENYLNTSIRENLDSPCILINASNVYLNCNGHTISNAPYGISASGQYNVSLNGCSVENSTYGIYFDGVVKFALSSVAVYNSNYGVFVANSTNGNLTGITASRNHFGVYINNTVYTTMKDLNVRNNTYGVLTDNSSSVYFSGGVASSNSKSDFYCTPSTYNSSSIRMSGTSCISTDCNWATSCPVKTLPSLTQYPIGSCGTIKSSGNYGLTGNIISGSSCFDISASNVTVSCNGHSVTGPGSYTAFSIGSVDNVNITRCKITQFQYGVHASGTSNVTVSSSAISVVAGGVALNGTSGSKVTNVTVNRYSGYGFALNGTSNSVVSGDSATSIHIGYGFLLYNAFNNVMVNDSANSSAYGFYIAMSRDNLVYNNSALSNKLSDFYCDGYSSPVYAQRIGIDKGVTGSGCSWLVLASGTVSAPGQKCTLITSPALITFSIDEVYPYGSTCFSIRSNSTLKASGTTINCNGHTVLATHGGAFVNATNTSNVDIENCVLIGFSAPISVSSRYGATGIILFNNTIADTPGRGIYLDNVQNSQVRSNMIFNTSTAAYLNNFNDSSITDNLVNRSSTGIYVSKSLVVQAKNNTVSSSADGLAFLNSSQVTLYDNKVSAGSTGLRCAGGLGGNADQGGNSCTGNVGCTWVTSPSCK